MKQVFRRSGRASNFQHPLHVESGSMVRRSAWFEALSTTDADSPAWVSGVAGLAVLDLIDAAREDPSVTHTDWTGVRAAVEAVSAIRDGSPLKRPLTRVMDELRGDLASWGAVNRALMAYGRALDLEGTWKLASDVFGTVAEIARAEREHELAIEATTALGGAARRSGDWDRSAEGYAEAAHLASALGDKASGLTVRVGQANTEIARGNLPAAQMIFDEVIVEAEKSGLDGVAALAYHGRASVAHQMGKFADAVSLGHKALELSTNPAVKDTIMSDIAAAFLGLGLNDAARDAYLVISLTSRYQWVRWQASINLMELASVDGKLDAFEDYAAELRNAALDPRLRAYFLLYYGEGLLRFGRNEEGRRYLEEARDFASRARIHQASFDAAGALAAAEEKRTRVDSRERYEPVSDEVVRVVDAIGELREVAVSSPLAGDWL